MTLLHSTKSATVSIRNGIGHAYSVTGMWVQEPLAGIPDCVLSLPLLQNALRNLPSDAAPRIAGSKLEWIGAGFRWSIPLLADEPAFERADSAELWRSEIDTGLLKQAAYACSDEVAREPLWYVDVAGDYVGASNGRCGVLLDNPNRQSGEFQVHKSVVALLPEGKVTVVKYDNATAFEWREHRISMADCAQPMQLCKMIGQVMPSGNHFGSAVVSKCMFSDALATACACCQDGSNMRTALAGNELVIEAGKDASFRRELPIEGSGQSELTLNPRFVSMAIRGLSDRIEVAFFKDAIRLVSGKSKAVVMAIRQL